MRRVTHFTLLSVLWLLLTAPLSAQVPALNSSAAEPLALPAAESRYLGVGSCTASACHGGSLHAPQAWQSSYSVWATRDKHARAYRVLFDLPARQIVARLDQLDDVQQAKPFEDRRCLGCHATTGSAEQRVPRHVLVDGISCEACHGPARDWIAVHTLKSWATLPSAEKYNDRTGMIHTKDLAHRGALCVECHVGSPRVGPDGVSRDMNHDMIAAGHPRLNFELATYQALMPAHWKRSNDEAQAWGLGQLLTTQAALDLLAHRAAEAAAKPTTVWPEFSEYDCFACHHDLRGMTRSQQSALTLQERDAAHRVGGYRWGSWHRALTPLLAEREQSPEAANALSELAKVMSSSAPNPLAARTLALTARDRLAPLVTALNNKPLDAIAAKQLLRQLVAAPRLDHWDDAAQLYLACVALNLAQPEPSVELQAALDRVRGTLRFPSEVTENNDRAAPAPPVFYLSPRDFDPLKLTDDFKQIQRLLDEGEK